MANVALVATGLARPRGVNDAAVTGPLAKVWPAVLPRTAPTTPPPPNRFFM
jgi:hypothetical protein